MYPTKKWLALWEESRPLLQSPSPLGEYFAAGELNGRRLALLPMGNLSLPTGQLLAGDPFYYLERWVSYNQSYKQVNDTTYDAMIEEANAQTDPAKRMEMLHEAEKYLVEENAYTIPLYGSGAVALMNTAVSGLKHDPTNSVYFDGLTY